MMRYTLITVSLLLFSCKTATIDSNKTKIATTEYEVKYFGALRNMMHKGDISAQVGLSDFENTPHFYAIGALENLKGEIQIIDGKPYNTSVKDSSILFDSSFDKAATLLVYATVKEWSVYDVPQDITTYEQLEKHVGLTAKANGIDVSKPFPFMLEGTASSFDWHVINWKDGDTAHSHEKHISSGLHGTIENREVELLGFYSDSHHAIFTHHTTNMHIHVKTRDNEIAGHVDGLTLGKGMILKFPSVK